MRREGTSSAPTPRNAPGRGPTRERNGAQANLAFTDPVPVKTREHVQTTRSFLLRTRLRNPLRKWQAAPRSNRGEDGNSRLCLFRSGLPEAAAGASKRIGRYRPSGL